MCKGFEARPILVDLFCCEGGASIGYHRAGFAVYGGDLFEDYSQKRYPFPSFKGDWQDALFHWLGRLPVAAVHASPPCQRHSAGTRAGDRSKYPDLIEPTREVLEATGLPYVIENVVGAPLNNPTRLCGCMFGLTAVDTDGIKLHLERPRLFEANFPLPTVQPCTECGTHEWVGGCYGGARRDKYEAKYVRKGGYVPKDKAVVQELMGITHMTWKGMYQSLPPAYTEWVGRHLLEFLQTEGAK